MKNKTHFYKNKIYFKKISKKTKNFSFERNFEDILPVSQRPPKRGLEKFWRLETFDTFAFLPMSIDNERCRRTES